MLNHVEELKKCKDLYELKRFARKYAGNDKYASGFLEALNKEKDFDKALQRVWNFALQKDGKYFLGKVGFAKHSSGGGGWIAGMECHSEGHR